MAQLVVDSRVVLLDRRRRITYDEPAVMAKWGVPPTAIPDWLALVGDSSDGYPGLPGWGAKSAAAVLARYGSLEEIPARASAWDVKSLRGGPVLAATLRERWDEVMLYRSLARLRTTDDGVEIPEARVWHIEWRVRTPRVEPSATLGNQTASGRRPRLDDRSRQPSLLRGAGTRSQTWIAQRRAWCAHRRGGETPTMTLVAH